MAFAVANVGRNSSGSNLLPFDLPTDELLSGLRDGERLSLFRPLDQRQQKPSFHFRDIGHREQRFDLRISAAYDLRLRRPKPGQRS